MRMRIAVPLLALLAGIPAATQVGMERASAPVSSLYPAEWPQGPGKDSLPSWARPGAIRFARWDGGAIETAKAMLSGWPGFNPPDPNRIYTMTNWYDPATVDFLRQAGINMIWVTFSNGFSNETERAHQERLRRYIDECHRSGIHVMAYESIANMFWDDMYERVPASRNWPSIGKDGKPVPYGAGDYTKMGRVTRYMADLANPEWRAYLRKRIDLAIDAGADGVIYDNNFSNHLFDVYQEIYQYGASRKRDFLLMGNFHANTYVFNRLVNCMTTEDGVEPGIYTEEHINSGRRNRDISALVPVKGGFLVNNIGLFRIHAALSNGWKPVMIEDGRREVGQRETTPMSGPRHQLALAESMMFGIGMELFVEGAFAHGLRTGDPETMDIWRAIGRYNRFFADNEGYYHETHSLARLAVVLDDRTANPRLLTALSARNIIYDVLYENDLTAEKLRTYSAVALLDCRNVRASGRRALEQYAKSGKLFATGDSVALGQNLPASADEVARTLRATEGNPAISVQAPEAVLYNALAQPSAKRVIVHLLNYDSHPTGPVKVTAHGRYSRVTLLSPDSRREAPRVTRTSGTDTQVEVPTLGIYSMLVLEP